MMGFLGFGPSDPYDMLTPEQQHLVDEEIDRMVFSHHEDPEFDTPPGNGMPEIQAEYLSGVYVRNEDGTLSPAEPVPWSPGMDWEVYHELTGYTALAYVRDTQVASVHAKSRFGIQFKTRWVEIRRALTKR